MPSYQAPLADTRFVLDEVLDLWQYAGRPGFDEVTPDLVQTILEEGARFAEEVLQPLNQSGDHAGCAWHPDHSVSTPPGFRDAYARYVEAGWPALGCDPAYGGQGLPHVVATALEEYQIASNMAFSMYPGLTRGAIAAISAVGSEAQKAFYLPRMVSGAWTGTMNLTEPQCGTDLGLLRTRAEPRADGTYALTGAKIFISAGEHDLGENIIHLVLARIPGSPESVRGISLFLVPKFLVQADGSLGARNAVTCGRIEEKMGIHGNATCVMNYDGATGFLLGEPDKGLRAMFVMMNAARLGVGLQGLAISEVATQNAAAYARERLQGRALGGPQNPAGKADPIIVHPDVRRMLMTARAFNEGARALVLWGALQVDLAHHAETPEARQHAEDLIGLLTPVIKAYLTDQGYQNATLAQQCFGGHGYVREWGMEQFVRDARIAMVYEGTNGVQALDLVGRKLAAHGGRALRLFLQTVTAEVKAISAEPSLAESGAALVRAVEDLQAATGWLMRNALTRPEQAGAASHPYLQLLALVAMGYLWLRMLQAAERGLAGATAAERPLHANKRLTAAFFFRYLLPETAVHRARVELGADPLMALPAEAF